MQQDDVTARLLDALKGIDLSRPDGRIGIGSLLAEIERRSPAIRACQARFPKSKASYSAALQAAAAHAVAVSARKLRSGGLPTASDRVANGPRPRPANHAIGAQRLSEAWKRLNRIALDDDEIQSPVDQGLLQPRDRLVPETTFQRTPSLETPSGRGRLARRDHIDGQQTGRAVAGRPEGRVVRQPQIIPEPVYIEAHRRGLSTSASPVICAASRVPDVQAASTLGPVNQSPQTPILRSPSQSASRPPRPERA